MDTSQDLEGIRAVVTGSTRGLGRAFADALLAHGASVVLNGVDEARCAAVADELGTASAAVVAGDVSDEAVAGRVLATAIERFGGVDLVVNNAGVTRDRTLLRMEAVEWDTVIDVHLRAAWAVSRAGARAMSHRGGSIVNVVSGSALFGLVGQSNYAAAKGGMLGLTRALSVELAPKGIRVNALYPVALTDMTRPVAELAAERNGGEIPFGDPADVAPAICALASPLLAHVTGQLIHCDGRTMTFWSHPQPQSSASKDRRWTLDEAVDFLAAPTHHEALHPDRWGAGTRTALSAPGSAEPSMLIPSLETHGPAT